MEEEEADIYRYDQFNRKVWAHKGDYSGDLLYLYGPSGELLAEFKIRAGDPDLRFGGTEYVYFEGRQLVKISWEGHPTALIADRLGSLRAADGTGSSYFPYGETHTGSGPMFATYPRSTTTNLHYAQNRWYSSQIGRFTTPDPYRASASLANPQSWNRYAYVENDPVNFNDPSGLMRARPKPGPPFPFPEYNAWASGWGWGESWYIAGADGTGEEGGGGWGGFGLAASALSKAASFLVGLDVMSLPRPCQNDIDALTKMSDGKISAESIAAAAGKLDVQDGETSAYLYNDVFKNSPNYTAGRMPGYTVATYFKQHKETAALTILGGNEIGASVVFVRSGYVNGHSFLFNTALVMHELLHSLGSEDDAILTALGYDPATTPSRVIGERFLWDCFGRTEPRH